jgi:DNA-binding transcriptional ArsR family regulator
MHPNAMNASVRILGILASLADPSRYRVVCLLAVGDYCVSEIAEKVGLSQSCTTRHLQTLQRAGVLTRTRAGKRVLFRIREDDAELSRVLELLVLHRPLDARPGPPRQPAAAGLRGHFDPGRPVELPRRITAVAGAGGSDTVAIRATSTGEPASDTPVASDAPPDAGLDELAAGVSAARGGTELEDFLL